MSDLQDKIKHQMETYGVTYRELSEAVDTPVSTLHYYFNNNDKKMPINLVSKLALPLHTTPEFLLGWESVEEQQDELYQKRKVLFDLSAKAKPEDLDKFIKMLEVLTDDTN